MPLLPPQSPPRVGEIGAAAPAIVMSRKSQSFADTAAAVIVRDVPIALERTNPRWLADEPAQVKVPLTVWLALMCSSLIPVPLAASVRLLKVFSPESVRIPTKVLVKEKLWNVKPPPLGVEDAPVRFICDVPALKVRFVLVAVFQPAPPEDKVKVLDPKLIVLTLELDDETATPVTLKFAVSNDPLVIVRVLPVMFNASPSVTVLLGALTTVLVNVLPAVISVPVPVIVSVPV